MPATYANSPYAADLELAQKLADAADAITSARFLAADLVVNAKPDLTPVSDADTSCEKQLRAILQQARPQDLLLGEEFGGTAEFSGRQWVIDPIDGTKNFVRGVPVWATLIALLEDGEPVVGVISAPALYRRWFAVRGGGAYRVVNGGTPQRIKVSQVARLEDAFMALSSLEGWRDRGVREEVIALSDSTWRLRGFGDFYNYCLVAEGAVDIAAEPEVSLWDLAPLSLLVCEAGGKFTSRRGVPGPHGGDAVASNGLLHAAVLKQLGSAE